MVLGLLEPGVEAVFPVLSLPAPAPPLMVFGVLPLPIPPLIVLGDGFGIVLCRGDTACSFLSSPCLLAPCLVLGELNWNGLGIVLCTDGLFLWSGFSSTVEPKPYFLDLFDTLDF